MPLRPYSLDPGFNRAPTIAPDIPQPERSGGFMQIGENWNNMVQGVQNLPSLFGAAFEIENDVVNTVELLSEPTWKSDPTFNLEANLKEAGLWDEHRWNFMGVESADHFLYKARKIKKELDARKLLQSAGADGVVASIIAGAASPTILLPFVGPGVKGAKAVATGLAWGFAGGALQEVPLQLNQELRTLEESAISIGFSTVLGGVLGGAVGYLNRGLDNLSSDMAPAVDAMPIPTSVRLERAQRELSDLEAQRTGEPELDEELEIAIDRKRSELDDYSYRQAEEVRAATLDNEISNSAIGRKAAAGADVLDNDVGRLRGMLGIGERLTKVAGPVTSVLGNMSATGRRMMANLSTAGLRLEGNLVVSSRVVDENGKVIDEGGRIIGAIPSSEGGTVEALIQSRRGDTLGMVDKAYEAYSDYWFGGSGKSPGAFRNTRAFTQRLIKGGNSGKLSRRQFFEEVGKAMRDGDVHDIPEVQRTAQEFRKYYDELLGEAQDLGLIPNEIKQVAPDLSFLNRVYDTVAIERNPNRFLELLENHFKQALQADVQKMHEAYVSRQATDELRLSDMDLPLDQAKSMRDQFQKELDALDSADDDKLGPLEELISDLRSDLAKNTRRRKEVEGLMRDGKQDAATLNPLRTELDRLKLERQTYREGIEELQALGGADLEARTLRKRYLKSRIRNLNRSRFMVEEKYRAKFDQMEALEEANIEALRRVARAANRALRTSDAEGDQFAKELNNLRTSLKDAQNSTLRIDAQIEALQTRLRDTKVDPEAGPEAKEAVEEAKLLDSLFKREAKRTVVAGRMQELAQDLEALENINWAERGRADVEGTIQDALTEVLERVNEVNTSRAKRIAKLEKSAEKFDDAAWQAKRAEIAQRVKDRKTNLIEKVRELGGDDFDITTGTAKFDERAAEIAQLARERISGLNVRLAGFDAMADKRGTELARTLSIPSEVLAREGFLVNDAEHLLHVYANTLIPDIELTKKLGPLAPDGERNLQFRELNEEMALVQKKFEADYREKAAKSGKPLDEGKMRDEIDKIGREYEGIRNNLDAVIRRLRGQWGIPTNPDGFATRAVQTILSLQALRFLGTVGLSSVPDISRPVFRYGLGRTLKAAWVPMFTNWKAIKMTADEARRAFVAVESATAQRAFQLSELMTFARRKTKAEAGLEWATSKIGIVAGFAPWTDLMKTLSSMTLNMKIMDSIDLSLNSVKTGKDRLEAIEFLNSIGLSENLQKQIWEEMQNGGAEQINGTWVPQTAKWTNKEAIRAYRAALYSEGAATTITPGVEVPKMVNSTLAGRLFFNLKSFALASTSKTLMAGLQQRDMAVLNGVMISLALGALSYYLKAVIAGGAAEERMRNATWQQWADEAVNASGILGAIGIGQQIASNIPGVRNVTTFSGGQASRTSGTGLIEDVAGPTADLAFTLAALMTGVDKPTRATIHKVRELMPFQNLFYLRRLFDQLENVVGTQFNLSGQPR